MIRTMIGATLAATALAPAAAQQRTVQLNMNVSPAGQAIVKRYLGTPDPRIQQYAARSAELNARQRALVTASKLDMAQFGAVLRELEQLQSDVRRMGNDRMLKMLGEMSEADRVGFVRGLASATTAPAAPPK